MLDHHHLNHYFYALLPIGFYANSIPYVLSLSHALIIVEPMYHAIVLVSHRILFDDLSMLLSMFYHLIDSEFYQSIQYQMGVTYLR